MGAARVDSWLWAVRLFKTRTLATEACRGGHVKVNGAPAKAATSVSEGDRIEVYAGGRHRTLEVVQVIDKRVGAGIAAACYHDHTPKPSPAEAAAFRRESGAGRPTKRDRRQLDRLRTRER